VLLLAFTRPGHWFGPVARPGWLGLAQPYGLSWTQPQRNYAGLGPAQPSHKKNKKINKINKIKNRKIKKVEKNKKCLCMNKNNVNLLGYSLTPESGIKIPV